MIDAISDFIWEIQKGRVLLKSPCCPFHSLTVFLNGIVYSESESDESETWMLHLLAGILSPTNKTSFPYHEYLEQ